MERKYGKDKQGENKVDADKQYMEEIRQGHKPIKINNVVGLRRELCGCLCVKYRNGWI